MQQGLIQVTTRFSSWAIYGLVALCVMLRAGTGLGQVSDDFSGSDSIEAAWSLVDPAGDSDWIMRSGWLTLSVPGEKDHDLRQGENRTPRLLQDVSDGDFGIEAKFQSLPTEHFQVQGLVAETDPSHFLTLDIRREGSALGIACVSVTGGAPMTQGQIDFDGQGPIWLRLVRLGDQWQGSVSDDGETWTEAFLFTHAMNVARVGVFGGNAGSGDHEVPDVEYDDPVVDKSGDWKPAPAFDVQVDYFFDISSPIDPEDGDMQNGVRVTDDLLALYYFQEGRGHRVLDHGPVLPRLDLTISDTNTMAWLPGGGIDLTSATQIATPGPAEKITTACKASNEITIEAWLHPASTSQSGPARIITVSKDPLLRNVSLAHGQWGSLPSDVYDVRLRTSSTSLNGQPETVSPSGSLTGELEHVVFTYDGGGLSRIYVDGVESVANPIGGDFGNWDDTYRLAFGSEMDGTRFWLGEILLTAIYDRALSSDEVVFNYLAGPRGGAVENLAPAIALTGISPGEEFDFQDPLVLSAVGGDANGNLVRVDFMVGDVLLFSDTEAPYDFTWNDPAVGSHLIKAVAVDGQGSQTTSEVIPILVTASPSFGFALFESDDYFDGSFGLPWSVADGTTGATYSQADGHLVVDLPAVTQDPWLPGGQEIFAHQAENDVDIALEFKLATTDFSGDTYAGIRFEGSGGEIVQLLGESSGGGWTVSWGSSGGGAFGDLGALVVPAAADGIWLQARRVSDSWSFFYSTDGLIWLQVASLDHALVLTRSGWVAGGLAAAGGPQRAAFDYSFDLANPIIPEDGGSGGDLSGPVIGPIARDTDLGEVLLSWETDEPAFFRLDYGETPAYELGTLQGHSFLVNHSVEVAGLNEGEQYHFRVTCVDTVGNFSITGDELLFTNAEAALSPGPESGDTYREFRKAIYVGEDWRVTDPEAANPGASAFLPNPVLSVQVPDLTGAVRAEMIIDRWGGHPGTTNKRIRLDGRSWLHLPELAAIPSNDPECYMYQDNLMIEIPLDQLQTGSITLEGTSDGQICYSFDWGQWGWNALVLRVYYDGSIPHPTGSIFSPAPGDTIIDMASIGVSASSAGTVEEVHVLGWYEGLDLDGDGVFTDWHRQYRRNWGATTVSVSGLVAKMTTAPWSGTWDVDWIPDQQPGSVKMQARILDDSGMWYVTDVVNDLSLRHSDGVVKLHAMDNVPKAFWVRAGKSMSAEFTIPAEDDLTTATEARMVTATWNGSDAGVIDINGNWQATNFGASHFYRVDTISMPVSALVQGVNDLTISSNTTHHGMEMLWPGPMFLVRYGSGFTTVEAEPGPGDLDADGRVDRVDALMILDHLVGAVPLTPQQTAAGDLSGNRQLDPWDAALVLGASRDKEEVATASLAWGAPEGRYGQLILPVQIAGEAPNSMWFEVTAPGMEDLVQDVTSGLSEMGLFRWRATGDKLLVAYAGSSPTEWPDRVLEIVLDGSKVAPGGSMSAALTVNGGEPMEFARADLTAVPVRYRLGENYPNPFNPSTKIAFDLPASGNVLLRVYNVRGQVVRTLVSGEMPFGSHILEWSGRDDGGRSVPSGVYFYRLEAKGFTTTRKMMLMK